MRTVLSQKKNHHLLVALSKCVFGGVTAHESKTRVYPVTPTTRERINIPGALYLTTGYNAGDENNNSQKRFKDVPLKSVVNEGAYVRHVYEEEASSWEGRKLRRDLNAHGPSFRRGE